MMKLIPRGERQKFGKCVFCDSPFVKYIIDGIVNPLEGTEPVSVVCCNACATKYGSYK